MMKKGAKVILILFIIAALIIGGYFVYDNFFASKMEEVDDGDGFVKYLSVLEKTNAKEVYTVNYSIDDSREKNEFSQSGIHTVDDYGYYHEWKGDSVGSMYIVKISGTKYGVFEENENKNSSTITASSFNANYGKIGNISYLNFLNYQTISKSEELIKADFYSSYDVEDDEFKHVFGKIDDQYVWRTTYKCKYNDGGVEYTSKLVRNVYFDTLVRKVTLELTDKELNDNGKVKRGGDKRTYEVSHSIEYKTNQTIVKVDFSEYPSAS